MGRRLSKQLLFGLALAVAGGSGWAAGGVGVWQAGLAQSAPAAAPLAVALVSKVPPSTTLSPVSHEQTLSLAASAVASELSQYGFGSAGPKNSSAADLARAVKLRSDVAQAAQAYNEKLQALVKAATTIYIQNSSTGTAPWSSDLTQASQEQSTAIYMSVLTGELRGQAGASKQALTSLQKKIGQLNGQLSRDIAANVPITKAAPQVAVPLLGSRGFGVVNVAMSIQGPAVLRADELANWYASVGFVNLAGMHIRQIAEIYLQEGAAENVRGDIAFMQSMIETGGFSVMSGANNFAGIGACDSCSSGYNYPSLRYGVRAQIELLRAYSDKNFVSSSVHRPLSYHGLDTLSVRGKCPTWVDLGGVWASGKKYGQDILHLYLTALEYTMSHEQVTVPAP